MEENIKVKQETPKAVVYRCEKLNVRSRPNKESEVLCVVKAGDVLTVKGKNNEWTRVHTDKKIAGYVMSEFIEAK